MTHLNRILPPALGLGLFAAAFSILPEKGQNQHILYQASQAVNEIAKKASPAVVSITSIKDSEPTAESMLFPGEASEQVMMGIGSGVIIRPEGLILTNYHVIQNAENVTVTLDDTHKVMAHVVGGDSKTDLALIRLDKTPEKKLPTLSFADSDQIQVGDWSVAIGSPFGLNRSVTSGIVSAVGRARLGMLDIEDFIQTDAAINPGSSGGPLLNVNGQMIGINTAIFSQGGGFIGIGFAVPSKIAKQVIDDLLKYGRVVRGWIGMSAQDLDTDLAQFFKVPSGHGALISQIVEKGPAEKATLKTGDVITKFGDTPVDSAEHLKALVAKVKSKSQVTVEIVRNGAIKNISVSIQEQPLPMARRTALAGQAAQGKKPKAFPYLGLSVQDIPPEFSNLFGISDRSGAFVTAVKVGSPAFDAGVGTGDIILSANQADIHSAKEFQDLVTEFQKSDLTVLYVQRGPDEKVFVPVKSKLS